MADKFSLDWGMHTPGVLPTKLAVTVLEQAKVDRESGSYIEAYEEKSLQEWAEHSECLARAATEETAPKQNCHSFRIQHSGLYHKGGPSEHFPTSPDTLSQVWSLHSAGAEGT